MRQEESEPNNSDARQQLDRWLGFLRRVTQYASGRFRWALS